MHYTHTVCEGDEFALVCPRGFEIEIEDAIFGRNDSYTCVHSYDVSFVYLYLASRWTLCIHRACFHPP